jgi:hypothetical protein
MMTAIPKRAMDITITVSAIFLLIVLLTFIDYHPDNFGVGEFFFWKRMRGYYLSKKRARKC